MFAALLIFLIMPIADTSRIRGNQFRPLNKFFFWVQVVVFGLLMWIGSQHPVEPFVLVGQVSTVLYFAWFIVVSGENRWNCCAIVSYYLCEYYVFASSY